MVKYNAIVDYPIKSNGHKKTHQVVVYFEDKNAFDENIIELADQKIGRNSKELHFTIEGQGSVVKRNYIFKV